MEYLEQAKTLYRKRHVHASALSSNDIAKLSLSITKLIRNSLMQQGGVNSFRYLPFIYVIQRTVTGNRFQGDRAAMAFSMIEKYLLHLLGQPWKREFWLLKTYGGFFCTKVKAHLERPEEVLELVGYIEKEESDSSICLVLETPPDPEVVLNVAFDCQVAVEECLYISEYYDKMKCVGLPLAQAMNVLLSGTSNDPVTWSSIGNSNNNIIGGFSDSHPKYMTNAAPAVTLNASGKVGMPGVNSKPRGMAGISTPASQPYTGLHTPPVVPNLAPAPQPQFAQHPYQHPADHAGLALKVDLSQIGQSAGIGNAGLQPASGYRAGYGSTVGAQSSGYSSESASVQGAPSSAYAPPSAYTSSSGYGSGSHPHYHHPTPAYNYTYPPHAHSGDQVDSPTTPVQQQYNKPSPRQPPMPTDFPFIDDDVPSPTPAFPEATHEQHLAESFQNMNLKDGQIYENTGVYMSPAPADMRRQPTGVREGATVTYNDWQWVQNDRSGGPTHNMMAGSGVMLPHQVPNMAQRPSQHMLDTRYIPNQPATAVTAMLNTSSSLGGNPLTEYPPALTSSTLANSQQKAQTGDYPPLTMVSSATMGGSHEQQANSYPVVHNMLDGHAHHMGGTQSQPVYYPPDPRTVPFQHYSNDPSPQTQRPPTFAQMTGSGRSAENAALLARQAHGLATSVVRSAEKDQIIKPASARREGSSSEVILREKLTGTPGHTRGSSLVAPVSQGQGFTRQSSQSMDLGMLKWRCRVCTMENSSVETICSACSKSRDVPELQIPAAGVSKKKCHSCTFENQPNSIACEICDTVLTEDKHTYV